MINGFQLYILTDYVGLDDGATARGRWPPTRSSSS